jgi:hypothetical protein
MPTRIERQKLDLDGLTPQERGQIAPYLLNMLDSETDKDAAWFVPAIKDEKRIPVDGHSEAPCVDAALRAPQSHGTTPHLP